MQLGFGGDNDLRKFKEDDLRIYRHICTLEPDAAMTITTRISNDFRCDDPVCSSYMIDVACASVHNFRSRRSKLFGAELLRNC